MNKVMLAGRLVRDPEVRYSQSATPMAIARYTLAVDRKYKKDGEANADFIPCIAFGKLGEFAEKYLKQGTKIIVTGRIQTGSYTNKEGVRVYTTDVIVEEQEFCESRKAQENGGNNAAQSSSYQQSSPYGSVGNDGFIQVPDGIAEELPFN